MSSPAHYRDMNIVDVTLQGHYGRTASALINGGYIRG